MHHHLANRDGNVRGLRLSLHFHIRKLGQELGERIIRRELPFVNQEKSSECNLSGKDPLTSSILMNVLSPHPEKMPVIGVVSNAHDLGVETEAEPVLYFPGFGVHAVLRIRTSTDPKSILPEVRNAVRELDPDRPIYHVKTIDEVLSDSLAQQRDRCFARNFCFAGTDTCGHRRLRVIACFVSQRARERWGTDGGWVEPGKYPASDAARSGYFYGHWSFGGIDRCLRWRSFGKRASVLDQ
jgi:hypothetical protein